MTAPKEVKRWALIGARGVQELVEPSEQSRQCGFPEFVEASALDAANAELKVESEIRASLMSRIALLESEVLKHEQALKDAVRVYGGSSKFRWHSSKGELDTHTGLLIQVEKIGAKDGE